MNDTPKPTPETPSSPEPANSAAKKSRGPIARCLVIVAYVVFVAISAVQGYVPGVRAGQTFLEFGLTMVKLLPCAFILVGLFEVWVSRETVEKHFGHSSGLRGHILAVLLAGTTVGGIYIAFPVGAALRGKGAGIGAVLTYIGASAICRIPMTIFEASFLGVKFSVVRLLVSIPLVIIVLTNS